MNDRGVMIVPMDPSEKKEVKKLMQSVFPFLMQLFFSFTPNILVAKKDGKIVGGVILKVFTLSKNRKCGLVAWIFSDVSARGLGVGQRLVESALGFFQEQGCQDVFASVEGFNTSSSKLFSTRGFSPISPWQQIRRYGFDYLPMLFHTFHMFDVGHFLWVKPGASQKVSSGGQWIATWLLNAVALYIAIGRGSGFTSLSSNIPLFVLISLGIFFGLRTVVMLAAAFALKIPVVFRMWMSGIFLTTAIALVFGGYFPIPGSIYPDLEGWSYKEQKSKIGKLSLVGILSVLLAVWLGILGKQSSMVGHWDPNFWNIFLSVGKMMCIVGIIIPVFPLYSYDGKRVLDWNKGIWAICAGATLATVFM